MNEFLFNNGIKLVYRNSTSNLTSLCISLDAGAARDEDKLGVAHATEHMVYKGTKNRTEEDINKQLSNIFGFQNAMTNYPYVIYYGTLLNDDFAVGIELFSDILINPTFKEAGFKEEMDIIMEELNEWDDELEQYCEDKLFLNSFTERRIKYPIIGTKESLQNITLVDIVNFYNKTYRPKNATIVVVSSLDFEDVKNIVGEYFGSWIGNQYSKAEACYEEPKEGIFYDNIVQGNSSKVQVIFPISHLTNNELKAFRIFNQYFGEGVNSVLFKMLRTDKALVYDVLTNISNESFIKLYKINFSVSTENINEAINCIKELLSNLDRFNNEVSEGDLKRLIKTIKLKRLFYEEQGVRLAKELATYNSMFGDYNLYLDEINGLESFSKEFILDVALKVLKNPSIEVVSALAGKR